MQRLCLSNFRLFLLPTVLKLGPIDTPCPKKGATNKLLKLMVITSSNQQMLNGPRDLQTIDLWPRDGPRRDGACVAAAVLTAARRPVKRVMIQMASVSRPYKE